MHFTGVINGNAVKMELCEDCSDKLGLNASFNFPPAVQPALNELMDLLSGWHAKSLDPKLQKSACPACRWTIAQFQKTGRMGCSECYLHFTSEADNCLKKIHGATVHKGKKAPADVAKAKVREREKSRARLQMDLDKAIKEERFEQAAEIRDRIRSFDAKVS